MEHRVETALIDLIRCQLQHQLQLRPLRVTPQPPKGRGTSRGGSSSGRGQQAPNRYATQTEERRPVLVYVARHREDKNDADVIAGSTHSYIASTTSVKFVISADYTTSKVSVVSPLGQFVQVDKVYRCVPLEIHGVVFSADLMEPPFGEFDLILRMDWLIKYRVSLDCTFKRVTLRMEENCEIVMIGEHRDYLANVISTLVAEKLVRKRCEAYLAFISNSTSAKLSVNDMRTTQDFPIVFLDELLGVPPNREVEFGIDLIPRTTLMSIAPYRMTSKELAELEA
ncbi:alcohol-forming fatty acyl-CoA reductase-like [Gossypium australe]|uniref:Alcohol-forming fatty acyl-CoA reductase-like n=1 Tax=Gossypium australe TaxID=47621 RepID=A0A5B6WEE3_9ROSI|nr:alcohol-forming fatty acyl-CoA reductase-like [Gossypium australe]